MCTIKFTFRGFSLVSDEKRRIQNKGEWVFPSVKSSSFILLIFQNLEKNSCFQCNLSFTFQDLRETFYFFVK